MITYIKKNINGNYVTLDNELDSAVHNDIGTTYEHYLNNWWVAIGFIAPTIFYFIKYLTTAVFCFIICMHFY